jgi:hypothetical protein
MFIEAVAQYLTKLRRSDMYHMSLLRSLGALLANSYKHHAPPELRSERLISGIRQQYPPLRRDTDDPEFF